jgi:hypothetical protein
MNWATAIPLVSLLAAVFTAGMAWTRLAVMGERLTEMKKELKDEHQRSADSQGKRIGDVEDKVGTLLDWRAEMKGATRERHRIDTKGIPVQNDHDE